ncbi:hypothetical protein DYL61_21990 [Pseudomonas nabeulensis]|uniref:Uncharacterized protein n=1 Tax=Pseudomonas nabeulensis TaxID=2293833 RepID=A0A4Z0AUX9_9PSED|nr:hypothetical protein [Pseudomonas nabeulensis]TFY89728.1 hypothetical protein DYL61_21990 [Pseudomonas nabeulensis]
MHKVIRNFTMTLLMCSIGNAYAAQEHNIIVELGQGLPQLQQSANSDYQQKNQLEALAQAIPEVRQTLAKLAKNTPEENREQARYGLYRQFFVDGKNLSTEQREQVLKSLRANPLIKTAEVHTTEDAPRVNRSLPVNVSRSTPSQRPAYLLAATPGNGYRLGGINSDAVNNLPGAQGNFARVVILTDSSWDMSHASLAQQSFHPLRPRERLACGLYWDVGRSGTQAAGIIADKNLGIVPAAQLMAAPSSWRGGIYFDDLNAANLKAGDVVVIDTATNENAPYFYPRDTCRGGTVCTLPLALAAGDENVLSSYMRNIEYLTEQKGVHVVINAGGGTKQLAESWASQFPGRYLPINLDNPALQGNFDRSRNDDGSILVGSINPRTGTAEGANYGSRIDVSTWGTSIKMADYQPGVKNLYTRYDADNPLDYRLSTWIIAGAVAKIQSIAFAKGLGPVPPRIMRQLLVDTGHDLVNATPGIARGKQPDVKAAVDKMLAAYANGFPPEPATPTIKRIVGVGFAAGDRGSSFGGARSNTTVTYTPVLNAAAKDVIFDWKVAPPLIIRNVNPETGELKVDVPAGVGTYWHQPPPRTTSVTLTTHEKNGITDTLSRSSSIVGVYTSDKTYAATWDVPDAIDAGQPTSFTVTPKPSGGSGYQIRWLAADLFPGVQEKTGTNAPYTIGVTAPPVTEDTHIKVEAGGTLQGSAAPIGTGFFLSKTVLVRAKPLEVQPLTGTLTVPASVVGGKEVLFSTDVKDVNGGGLSYKWTPPPSFIGATDRAVFSGFAPSVSQDMAGQVEVLVSDTKGQQLRLSQPVNVTANLPSVSILGPNAVASGQTVTLTAQVSNPPPGTLRYSWRMAPGFTGTPSNSPSLTLTAPQVTQPTTAVISVSAGVGMNQATASITLTIAPR